MEHNNLISVEKLDKIYENAMSETSYAFQREKLILAMLVLEHLGILAPGETGKHLCNKVCNSDLKNIVFSTIIRTQQVYIQNQLKREV